MMWELSKPLLGVEAGDFSVTPRPVMNDRLMPVTDMVSPLFESVVATNSWPVTVWYRTVLTPFASVIWTDNGRYRVWSGTRSVGNSMRPPPGESHTKAIWLTFLSSSFLYVSST